mgnify:CR=1 FL=1
MGVYGCDAIGKDNACDSCVLMESMCPDFLNEYAVVDGRDINHRIRAGADAGNHPMGAVRRHGIFQPLAYILRAADGAHFVFIVGVFAEVRHHVGMFAGGGVPVVGFGCRPLPEYVCWCGFSAQADRAATGPRPTARLRICPNQAIFRFLTSWQVLLYFFTT